MKFHAGHRSLSLALVALHVCAACAPRVGTQPTSSGAGQQIIAKAQAAGWTPAELTRLRTLVTVEESLSDKERRRLKCRLGRVFQARKPLTLVVLQESGATTKELTLAAAAVDAIADAKCSSNDSLTGEKRLGSVFLAVNDRLTSGTLLQGQDIILDGFEDVVREMLSRCFDPSQAVTLKSLTGMSETEFVGKLDQLAFGKCSRSETPGIRLGPASSDPTAYAQCVREAFREGTKRTEECSDIAGQDRGNRSPERTPERPTRPTTDEPREEARANPNPAADEQDADTAAKGEAVALVGLVVVLVGAAVENVGVAGIGVALMLYGLEQANNAADRYVDRNGERPPWSGRSCPAFSTPAGSLGFANMTETPSRRMTVMDGMRACRCENNPLDQVIGKQALGAFGGPSCELGTRLRCLREADNDVAGPRDPDCIRMLQDDNKRSLAAQMKQCAVISCGTDAIIGKDCSCSSYGGSAGGGGGLDRCATVRCESGKRPVSDGIRCTCTDDVGGVAGAPGMPTVGCPPGSPPGCKPPTPGSVRVPGHAPPRVPGRGMPPPVPKCAPGTPRC